MIRGRTAPLNSSWALQLDENIQFIEKNNHKIVLLWKSFPALTSCNPSPVLQVQLAGSPPALWVTGPWAAPQRPPPPQPCGPASTAPSWTSPAQSTVKCAACPAVKNPHPALLRPASTPRPALLLTRQWHHCTRTSCEIWICSFSFASLWSLSNSQAAVTTRLHRIQRVTKIKPDCFFCFVSLLTAALVSGGAR